MKVKVKEKSIQTIELEEEVNQPVQDVNGEERKEEDDIEDPIALRTGLGRSNLQKIEE